MQITEQELEWLIRESTEGCYLDGAFGPGWYDLSDVPSNEWARLRIEEIRAGGESL